MSPKLVRLILALALALAVPVQAIGAVMAGICMAAGHHEAGHALVLHSGDQHDHSGEAPGPESAAVHSHDGGDGQTSAAHCAPCVACCAAASISSAAQTVVHELPAAHPIAAAADNVAGFQPGGLDRPPLAL